MSWGKEPPFKNSSQPAVHTHLPHCSGKLALFFSFLWLLYPWLEVSFWHHCTHAQVVSYLSSWLQNINGNLTVLNISWCSSSYRLSENGEEVVMDPWRSWPPLPTAGAKPQSNKAFMEHLCTGLPRAHKSPHLSRERCPAITEQSLPGRSHEQGRVRELEDWSVH